MAARLTVAQEEPVQIRQLTPEEKRAARQRRWSKTERGRAREARHSRNKRRRDLRFLRAYLKGHPCVDCGETDLDVLQFDHVRGPKLDNVSDLAWKGRSLKTLRAEIAKCEVRCANCHIKRHACEEYKLAA